LEPQLSILDDLLRSAQPGYEPQVRQFLQELLELFGDVF